MSGITDHTNDIVDRWIEMLLRYRYTYAANSLYFPRCANQLL